MKKWLIGFISGMWFLFIIINISIKLKWFNINTIIDYPNYMLIIGVIVCIVLTIIYRRD